MVFFVQLPLMTEDLAVKLWISASEIRVSQRPLSRTKRGVFIALLGGVLAGPLGIIVSPLVLFLVSHIKKDGNRFLVWAIIGLPASIVLWAAQVTVLMIIGMAMMEADALGRNGMKEWRQLTNAKDLMPSPDWCIHTEDWIQDQMDITNRIKTLRCYAFDNSVVTKSNYLSIICETEADKDIYFCKEDASRQFSAEEAAENKKKFGSS